jgi:TfoX/Sxy family transcriptional regulator of competence genes
MGDIRTEDADNTPGNPTDESHLRGGALDGDEQKKSVAHTAYEKARNPDATLHLDDEEDTLYDDGLEIEDGSAPLTGKDGRDDT